MESTSILSSFITSFHPKHCSLYLHPKRASSSSSTRIFASRNEAHDQNYYGGRLVDESMIVLRKRIREMKMVERNDEPPSDWMDWEKRYYTSYDSIICELMGLLQSQLMNTRPGLAFGMMALIILSVPTSSAVVLFHLIEFTKSVLARIST
ncbi:hypothetical protein CMV_026464 [Castanea mollissima]|uniref:Uncharacterized protein n=1 Tax=Castanea mollissima TaxID=60419 RepID=A0A8J4VAD7_9ROSI|nr:hypothetical protein CMV_026464 [Castanea mollissima]